MPSRKARPKITSNHVGEECKVFVRLYSGDDGESHFEDLDLPEVRVQHSAMQTAGGMTFVRLQLGRFIDWHPAPRRQYLFTLSGQIEIGVGDGSVRRLRPGDVLMVEDLTGRGHTTRASESEPTAMAIVPLTRWAPWLPTSPA